MNQHLITYYKWLGIEIKLMTTTDYQYFVSNKTIVKKNYIIIEMLCCNNISVKLFIVIFIR